MKENPLTLYILLGVIVFSSIFYIYCVNVSVRNVVARKNIENSISTLRNEVSEMEYKYISQESSITLDMARNSGLKELEDKVFVSQNDQSKMLSFGGR